MALATLGVIAASVGFGLVPLFARSLLEGGIAPHAIAFYRYVLASIVLLPLLYHWRQSWRAIAWGIFVGLCMGLGWVGYVRAIEVVPVSTAGVLYMTYPVFTLFFAWVLFGERPVWQAILGALVIIAAAMLVSRPGAIDPAHVPLLLVSLAAPAGFGLGIAVLVHRLPEVPALVRIGSASLGSVIGLLPLVTSSTWAQLVPMDSAGWLMVVGIGLGTALIPQLLYTVSSPIIGTARSAAAGSIELPVMFVVGWLAYGESLSVTKLIACAMVLGAIILTPSRRARSFAATTEDSPLSGR